MASAVPVGCMRWVSLLASRPGEARKAMFAVWAAVNLVKQVIVVDDDIDPWNALEVEWASATRAKPDRDHVVISRCSRRSLRTA